MVKQAICERFVRVIWLCIVIHVFSLGTWAAYSGGSGTPEDPYLIFTAEHLNAIGTQPGDWNKHFKLMTDIDLSGYREMEFNRIGTPEQGAFTGVFDGNYQTVSNFRWSSEFARYVGLFGFVDGEQARIMNLAMTDATVAVESGEYVAVMIGFIRAGTVTNCHVRRSAVSSEKSVGGLIGQAQMASVIGCTACATVRGVYDVGGLMGISQSGLVKRCRAAGVVIGRSEIMCLGAGGLVGSSTNGQVTECHAACTVEGDYYVGGLIGLNYAARVDGCWADGTASGMQGVGGLAGENWGGAIADSYALTKVVGAASVGGLVGCNGSSCETCGSSGHGRIDRCYAAGSVAGGSDIGGLVGLERKGFTRYSFWDAQVAGSWESPNGTPLAKQQMQDPSTYIRVGWDFVGESSNGTNETWRMPANAGYPQLSWQVAVGDFDADGDVDFHDYQLFAERWRRVDTGFWSSGTWIAADGIIDLDDLLTLAQGWLLGKNSRRAY